MGNHALAGRRPDSAGLRGGREPELLTLIPPIPQPPSGAPRAARSGSPAAPAPFLPSHMLSALCLAVLFVSPETLPSLPHLHLLKFFSGFQAQLKCLLLQEAFLIVPEGEDANSSALNVRSVHTVQPGYTIPGPPPPPPVSCRVPPLSLNSY